MITLLHRLHKSILYLGLCLLLLVARSVNATDADWVYTVQISATVQVSPPRIMLGWEPDEYGANSYTVYRKAKNATSWGVPIATLSGSTTNLTDSNVVADSSYEYRIVKAASLGYTGYGYIYAGINAPLTEGRGKLLLIVATNATTSLSNEMARLQSDLTGDGWQVLRHDVSSNGSPASVRTLITNDYYADPANVSAVFLFGHVPILQSGNLNYDGHLTRPMPADAYYADMNNDWPTNPATSPSFLPSDVTLMVGRVDLFNMPGNGAPVPWPNEVELLRNYLNKDHNWRHNLINVQRRALIGDLRGAEGGEATAASGYRNFEPLVGPDQIVQANVEYGSPPGQRWISMLTQGSYLWAFGCGAGQPFAVSGLGTNDGTFYDVWSTDVVGLDAHVVFVMLFGSWFGQWDYTDDLMRSFLATPTMGLTCCLAGRPHWFVHHMGLGETIGYSTRLTMNNSTLYQNQTNNFTRAIYIALMGDPTLRQDPVSPPAGLSVMRTIHAVNLNWSNSPDATAGYHVYRAATPAGTFSRLTTSLISGISFSDTNVSLNIPYTYMVRAIKLQTTPSGTYFNPSQGIFAASPAPIVLQASRSANGLLLTWNTQLGALYHVQSKTNVAQTNWTDLSGSITATNASTAWTDTAIHSNLRRFYRVASP